MLYISSSNIRAFHNSRQVTMADCTYVETCKGKKAIIHEGYVYHKIRENGSKSWWRCRDRNCKGKVHVEDDKVTSVCGEHLHPPNFAQAAAERVVTSMRKRAREETTAIPKLYAEEVAAATGESFVWLCLPLELCTISSLRTLPTLGLTYNFLIVCFAYTWT